MCLAVPLKLVKIDGNDAVAEENGVSRNIKINFVKEPKVGDYVIVHAGFAIEKLKEREALESIKAWNELREVLGEHRE